MYLCRMLKFMTVSEAEAELGALFMKEGKRRSLA